MKIQNKHKGLPADRHGFTLLETTVAIGVLVAAIVAPLSLASQSIKSASLARSNIIVANLAQEGVELIKNYRSNNILQGQPWTDGMGFCFNPHGCQIDPQNLSIQKCAGSGCDFLKFDANLRLYNYQTGSDTLFKRTITMQYINNPIEFQVTVSMTWNDRFGDHRFNLKTSMLDW